MLGADRLVSVQSQFSVVLRTFSDIQIQLGFTFSWLVWEVNLSSQHAPFILSSAYNIACCPNRLSHSGFLARACSSNLSKVSMLGILVPVRQVFRDFLFLQKYSVARNPSRWMRCESFLPSAWTLPRFCAWKRLEMRKVRSVGPGFHIEKRDIGYLSGLRQHGRTNGNGKQLLERLRRPVWRDQSS